MEDAYGAETLDWSKLPIELSYLADAAEKYGRFQFDDRIRDYLFNAAGEKEIRELRELSILFEKNGDLINTWFDKFNMRLHPEARLIYFTQCLVGTACDLGII